MSARRAQPAGTPSDLPPEKAHAVLSAQLKKLQELKGHSYQETKAAEDEWVQLTEKLVIRSFGSESTNYSNFRSARSAGEYFIRPFGGGEDDSLNQRNFETRLQAYESALNSSLSELVLDLPSPKVKGTNEAVQTPYGDAVDASTRPSIQVFISHSSKDTDLALALIEMIKAGLGPLQIRCSSVDGYRLPVGVNTEAKLREEVNAAKVVIGLVTPSSLASAFVMFELGARWGANQFLAPLLAGVKPSELSGPLSLLNALSSTNESQLHQLLEDISKKLSLPLQNAASYVRYISTVRQISEGIQTAVAAQSPEKEEMVFEESVYWKRKNGEREGPYCPVCYDDKRKTIHLTPGATKGTYGCGACQNSFHTNEYEQGQRAFQ